MQQLPSWRPAAARPVVRVQGAMTACLCGDVPQRFRRVGLDDSAMSLPLRDPAAAWQAVRMAARSVSGAFATLPAAAYNRLRGQ